MQVTKFQAVATSSQAAVALQKSLANRVRLTPLRRIPRFIAGVDCSIARTDTIIFAAAVVYDVIERRVVETRGLALAARFPYRTGLLSFREGPAALAALARLRHDVDAVMFDGQGYAHPRRLGLACHVGLSLDRPTLGCAKSRLLGAVRGELGDTRTARQDLFDHDERIGVLLRTKTGVKPVYVSAGNGMTHEDAVNVVLSCHAGYRLPEPTRLADQETKRLRREARFET